MMSISPTATKPAAAGLTPRLPVIPAAFFGIVLGLAGLGGSWRVAHRLWGLPAGIGEALMLLRLLLWVVRQPFAPSYWAFSFGATALATAALLAVPLFGAKNIVIAVLILGTVRLAVLRRLLPRLSPAVLMTLL